MKTKFNLPGKNDLQIARGYFDLVEYTGNQLIIKGWMLLPDKRLDNFLVFINKKFICETSVIEREGVGKAYSFIPHAKYSGFSISLQIDKDEAEDLIDICLIGIANSEHVAKMETWYSKKITADLQVPLHLMQRVANTDNSPYFWASAFKSFRDYWENIYKNNDHKVIKTMLDWGCGCGRLIFMFMNFTEVPEIHGCDIDHESIDWCKKNFHRPRFEVIPFSPPTSYPDNYFDLIIGHSVFTHLTKENQLLWLKEMERILTPGGLFLASVHGEFATYFSFPDSVTDILKDGIYDRVEDNNLEGIAPSGYYRGTYQSEEYTRNVFGRYFQILEYVERGCLSHQDLVVMRKS